ncbi:serine hydrolase domain-containing protein [Nocardiopsis quinghaiensis]|uniref:serine hydrolase domain-containing protein n=1 Tax=Nocardiopsis quinghaiensis TaxID=464995 RepID=UPI001CC23D53|nr:serine hydrolase domain-containing protein [Nocardiopsis quinghaiensis]
MPRTPRVLPMLAAPLMIIATLAPGAASATTAPGEASAPADTPSAAAPLTPETAREFADTRVAELLEEHGAPGVAVTVVAGGEQIASASHGYADLADETPMDHTVHTLPTGSVSKSFTAAAVLTLVEQGGIDLDEDVNTYLPEEARLPVDGVTTHQLLTHTAGFEEVVDFPSVEDTDLHFTLEELFRTRKPEQLHEPGRFTAYSNHGSALAGYIVQEVSGVPFEEYVAQNVFTPLGMEGSEFLQVYDARESYEIPTFHLSDGGEAEPMHITPVPAGASVASTDDMARFMLALLGEGEIDGERVLPARVAEQMLASQHEVHPETADMGYGTYQWRGGDSPVIGHGGDLVGMHTAYVLIPGIDAGMFVAVNGDDTIAGNPLQDLRMTVAREFADTFDPQEPPTGRADTGADTGADMGAYTGTYVTSRRAANGPAQIVPLFDNMVVREVDGALSVSGMMALDDRWLPVGGGRFVAGNREDQLVFMEEDGEAVALAVNSNPTHVYERTTLLTNPVTHGVVAAAGLLVLFTAFLHFRRPRDRFTLVARVLAALTALSCFAGLGLIVYGLLNSHTLEQWIFGESLALTLPLALAIPLALATAAVAVTAWVRGWLRPVGRIHLTLVVLAAAAVILTGAQYGFVWMVS